MPYSDSPTQPASHASVATSRDSATATAHAPSSHYSTNGTAANEQAEILARAQAGDNQAFAQLYSLHKRRIYSLCLRMVGSVAEAEDLTQEAFLQFHRKIDTFRGESALSTWLHRLAINVVLMHLRKKGLQLTSLDEAMEPAPDQRPGRSFGAPDLILSGAIDRLPLKVTNTTKLPLCWIAPSATASRSCTRRVSSFARRCAPILIRRRADDPNHQSRRLCEVSG